MSWPASIFSALLTGLLALFVGGFIAAMAVDWYHISGREGESGYFVAAIALLSFGAGLVIGLITARMVAAGAQPGFLKALGISLGLVIGIGALSLGLTRALADVPPEIDGEPLLLAVEVRWPAGQEAPTVEGKDEASIGLHSIPYFSHTVRASEYGPLWMEDAHQVDRRWVVPGAVNVFTSRGTRMLTVNTGGKNTPGFEVRLPAFPRKKNLEWSGWEPDFLPGVKVPPDLVSFRYRVQKVSSPIRTESLGPFEVMTIASWFHQEQLEGRTVNAANASFALRYRGQPLVIEGKTSATGDSSERFDLIDDVALLAGPRPAFLIHVDIPTGAGYCYLVAEEEGRVRIDFVSAASRGTRGPVLTSDPALFRAAAKWQTVNGRIDRISYSHPGLYRIGFAVVDTRALVVRHFSADSTVYDIPAVPPLGLSPDERSFVTYTYLNDSQPPHPMLLVTDAVANRTYTLPIDPARMRYAKFEALDPAWLDHHFEWMRGADGVDRLVERRHFVPLPYKGELSVESDGYRTYRLEKGSEALREALVDLLVRDFKAERQPAESGAYQVPVTVEGTRVNVAFSSEFGYVMLSTDRGTPADTTLIARLGERVDAALATGKYDSLFTP
ncbi:MAG TPA: hypothetical protein VLA89_07155 [Gemmatimonadales bacterium]|nr:hypothetical protein [Gemmatimonadales bacterium]